MTETFYYSRQTVGGLIKKNIPVSLISHFESDYKLTAANFADKSNFLLITETLKSLESRLPNFVRISRSILVNRAEIAAVGGLRAKCECALKNGKILRVSRRYAAQVKRITSKP